MPRYENGYGHGYGDQGYDIAILKIQDTNMNTAVLNIFFLDYF